MTRPPTPKALTVVHLADRSSVEVHIGDTIRFVDGWVMVTKKVMMPGHELSVAANGLVEQTKAWPPGSVKYVETIREVLS